MLKKIKEFFIKFKALIFFILGVASAILVFIFVSLFKNKKQEEQKENLIEENNNKIKEIEDEEKKLDETINNLYNEYLNLIKGKRTRKIK